VIKRSS